MASNAPQRKIATARSSSANVVSTSDRYPLGGGRSRFAYVSQFFSERYQKTYTNVDIREYRDIEKNTKLHRIHCKTYSEGGGS